MGDEVLSGDEGVVPGREDGEAVDRLTDEHQMAQHVVMPAHIHMYSTRQKELPINGPFNGRPF